MKLKHWLILCFSIPSLAWAQDVRHLKGMKDLRLGGGITQLGSYGNIGFGYNLSSKTTIGGDILYEKADYQGIKFNSIFVPIGMTFTPFNLKERLYFNINYGIMPSYTMLADINGLKEGTKKSGISLGVYLGPEFDLYLSNRIILSIYYKQSYLPLHFLGNAVYFIGCGLKFSIN